MKTELLKIAQDLEQDTITENEARTLLLGLLGVSGSCFNLIKDIEKLPRYDIWGTETEGSTETHYSNDGECVNADDLYDILKNYR